MTLVKNLGVGLLMCCFISCKRDNGNVHRAAANIIVSKSRAARGSVCNVLLSRDCVPVEIGVSVDVIMQNVF